MYICSLISFFAKIKSDQFKKIWVLIPADQTELIDLVYQFSFAFFDFFFHFLEDTNQSLKALNQTDLNKNAQHYVTPNLAYNWRNKRASWAITYVWSLVITSSCMNNEGPKASQVMALLWLKETSNWGQWCHEPIILSMRRHGFRKWDVGHSQTSHSGFLWPLRNLMGNSIDPLLLVN